MRDKRSGAMAAILAVPALLLGVVDVSPAEAKTKGTEAEACAALQLFADDVAAGNEGSFEADLTAAKQAAGSSTNSKLAAKLRRALLAQRRYLGLVERHPEAKATFDRTVWISVASYASDAAELCEAAGHPIVTPTT
jgi:hypothetical protein